MNKKNPLIPHLDRSATRSGIGDGPGGLLPCAELSLLKDLYEHREDVGIDYSLRRKHRQTSYQTNPTHLKKGDTQTQKNYIFAFYEHNRDAVPGSVLGFLL